jgi:hypothetical protein
MPDASLRTYEREVENARSKLANDLATLRSPATLSTFTDDLKHEALGAKDALVETAKSKAQSTVNGILEDLKAKAAANPAAALAIGAGIAWRLIKNPPIATVLVGAGLFSLLRTNAPRPAYGERRDYLALGKERLKEQVADLAASAKEATTEAGAAVAAEAAGFVDAAKDKAREWTDSSRQAAEQLASTMKTNVRSIADDASVTASRYSEEAQNIAATAYARAGAMMQEATTAGGQVIADPNSRDKLLLGVAGVAVAAALGIAVQKRVAQSVESG